VAVQAGVIGCGFQGRLHVDVLSRLPDVELVAVADIGASIAELILSAIKSVCLQLCIALSTIQIDRRALHSCIMSMAKNAIFWHRLV